MKPMRIFILLLLVLNLGTSFVAKIEIDNKPLGVLLLVSSAMVVGAVMYILFNWRTNNGESERKTEV